MSFPTGIQTPPTTPGAISPELLLGNLEELKGPALKTLEAALKFMKTVPASDQKPTVASEETGLPELEAPKRMENANDISLRIGLLQDALNQLMAQVSKSEIKGRMNEMQKENQRQLDRFEEQMKKAAEAAKKNEESQKKGNIFEAISNWVQAAISVISAVVTLISAVGQILTNPVGAAALFVASAALIGAAAVQITLAIDATLVAAGEKGFLSETDKTNMKKAAEILGYVAMVASLIGLVGGVVVALSSAAKTIATTTGREVTKMGAAKLVGEGMKQVATKSSNMGFGRMALEAYKTSMKPMTQYMARLAVTQGLGQAANATVTGVGNLEVANIKKDASALQEEADKAEAAAKAIAAVIAKLQALIEQLQQELEEMMEQGQQTMSIIFGTIDESAASMTRIQQTFSA